MTDFRPAVRRLLRELDRRGVPAQRMGSRSVWLLEPWDGKPAPIGLTVALWALHPNAGEGHPLRGFAPRAVIARDFEGTRADGRRLGTWLAWKCLYNCGLWNDPPPRRWQDVVMTDRKREPLTAKEGD